MRCHLTQHRNIKMNIVIDFVGVEMEVDAAQDSCGDITWEVVDNDLAQSLIDEFELWDSFQEVVEKEYKKACKEMDDDVAYETYKDGY